MEQTSTQPTKAGKGLGVAGFVISLVALVLWVFVSGAALFAAALGGGMGLAIFWVVVSLIGLILSIMGFMKAKNGGGKKGLAIAGLIIGLVATGLSVRTVFGVKQVQEAMPGLEGAFKEGMQQMSDSLANGMKEAMEQAMDSTQQH